VDIAVNRGQNAYDMPSVKVIVDDGPPVFVTFGISSTHIALATGLSASTHTVLLYMMGANSTLLNSWTGTIAQTHILSLQLAPEAWARNDVSSAESFSQTTRNLAPQRCRKRPPAPQCTNIPLRQVRLVSEVSV